MPTIINGFEVYAAGELPPAKPRLARRGTRRKYPWYETAQGGGFQFSTEVTEQSARVQASKMSGATGFEFKVYYDAQGALWCARVDNVPRMRWPDGGNPHEHRFIPVEPLAPEALPAAAVLIDDGDVNLHHDGGTGTPTIFGKQDEKWMKPVGPPKPVTDEMMPRDVYAIPEFEPSGDPEWDRRAKGGVESDGL